MRISLKFWFLRHYWWLLPLAFTPLAGGVVVVGHGVDFRLLLTIVGTLLSLIYFLQTQRVQEVKLFREIFAECNRRYDELSERLNAIRNEPIDQPLNREELGTLMKYLDLCGEEYLYYSQGYLFPEVWSAWHNGMRYFLGNRRIAAVWRDEKKTDSYYGLPL